MSICMPSNTIKTLKTLVAQVLSLAPSLKKRLLLLVGMVIYVNIFIWIYRSHLHVYWEYWGFNYKLPSLFLDIYAWVLALIPILWLPIHILRPSQVIYWVLYLISYIPSIFSPIFMRLNGETDLGILISSLALGFFIIQIPYLFPLPALALLKLSWPIFKTLFFSIVFLLFAQVIYVYWGNFNLVSFSDVYSIRFSAGELAQGNLVAYAVFILSGCLMPILLSWGLYLKKKQYIILAIAGLVLLYSTGGHKMMVFMIFTIFGIYYFFTKNLKNFSLYILSYLIVLWTVLAIINEIEDLHIMTMGALSLFLMRILGNTGLTTALYFSYFSTHPVTYFSHINVMQLFIHYPYQYQLGLEVGYYFMGDPDLNLNAIFWATDGLAALGVWGIPVCCSFVATVFLVMDMCLQKHAIRFVAMATLPCGMSLLNSSLFTTLLSAGMGLSILLLYLMPTIQPKIIKA